MDACDGGTPRDAVEALVDRHAAAGRAAVEADVLASVRSLLDRKIVEPAR
jgi:hypothetical protein